MSGQRELIFRHALVRDVAYESLPRRDRVAHAPRRRAPGSSDVRRPPRRGRRADRPPPGGGATRLGATERAARQRPSRRWPRPPRARTHARASSGRSRSRDRRSSSRRRRSTAPARSRRSATPSFVAFDGSTAWESLREAADIVAREAPDDRMRLAEICGFAVMIPSRAPGLMRSSRRPTRSRRYLELGPRVRGRATTARRSCCCSPSQGFWDFGFGVDPDDEGGERARAAAERAREIAQRLGRPDLELLALDALSAGLNVRGLYGLAEPIDRERLSSRARSATRSRSPTPSTPPRGRPSRSGTTADGVALAAEFEARGRRRPAARPLSLVGAGAAAARRVGRGAGRPGAPARVLGETRRARPERSRAAATAPRRSSTRRAATAPPPTRSWPRSTAW